MTHIEPFVRAIVEETIGGSPVEIGNQYIHPEDGLITITAGQFWGDRGISNHWHWRVEETGGTNHGYGDNWPAAPRPRRA